MVATLSTALRRVAGIAFLLLAVMGLAISGHAQQGSSPLVTSSVLTALPSALTNSSDSWGQIWQAASDSHGNFLAVDFASNGIYEFPAKGGPMQELVAQGSWGGGWSNLGLAIDPWNNIWTSGNWGTGGLYRFPYDPATNTWNMSLNAVQLTAVGNCCNNWWIQSAALAFNSNGVAVASLTCCSGNQLVEFTVDSSGNTSNGALIVGALSARARTLAIDNAGNIYIHEDGGQPGILMIPAGVTGLTDDTDPRVVRIDPYYCLSPAKATCYTDDPKTATFFLTSVTGAAVDQAGNVYVGDNGSTTAGIYMIPNINGAIDPTKWVLLTPASVQGQTAVTPAGDKIFSPFYSAWSNNGVNYGQNAAAAIGSGELGSVAVGSTSATPAQVFYSFSGRVTDAPKDSVATIDPAMQVTPSRFVIQEENAANPDFAVTSGGTCAVGTTYPIPADPANSKNEVNYCTLNVNFTPTKLGNLSAQLLMQINTGTSDKPVYVTVATTTLHGTGLASAINAIPAVETTPAGTLKTPGQVATDIQGNVYVADAGLGQVLEYAGGSAAPVAAGHGFTAPTGVALDGAGNLYVADSGNVLEIPYNTTGVASNQYTPGLDPTVVNTLATGLGANVQLAVDGIGHVYAADPNNKRIVEIYGPAGSTGGPGAQITYLTAGLTAPSSVAADGSGNLYVIDDSNLLEISNGEATTITSGLTSATGLAVDASGSVYIASSSGSFRIPAVSGALNPSGKTPVATSVTSPSGIAVDYLGNVYLADATALGLHAVQPNGTLDFGYVELGDQPSLNTTLINSGNAPLNIKGYTSTNPLDYTAADGTCVSGSPVAPGATCAADVTLAPGAGEQGTLTGQISFLSDASNAPVVVNTTGVSAPLANTTSSISVGSGSEAVNTTVNVTVKPVSGTTVPTGQVIVSYIDPTGAKVSATATLNNGTAALTLAPVHGGSNAFTVNYEGDRVYGRSTGATTATIARSAVAMTSDPNPPSYLPYVLESNEGTLPYDGSASYWEYNWTVTVAAGAGAPTGTVTFMEGSSPACPQNGSSAVQAVAPNGQAIFATNCLQMPQNVTYVPITSSHTLTPVYSGDDSYLPVTGASQTFIAVRSPAVMLSSSPATINVTAGTPASANITLNSILGYGWAGKGALLNDYQFPVSLTCANLPPHATCSFSYPNPDANTPNSVDLPCTGSTGSAVVCQPGQAVLTINTNVAVGTTSSTPASKTARKAAAGLAFMLGFGVLGVVFRRKAGVYGNYLLALGATLLLFGLTACSTKNLSPEAVLTTPPGTYQVDVIAIQVGSQSITSTDGTTTEIYGSQAQVSIPFKVTVTVQ